MKARSAHGGEDEERFRVSKQANGSRVESEVDRVSSVLCSHCLLSSSALGKGMSASHPLLSALIIYSHPLLSSSTLILHSHPLLSFSALFAPHSPFPLFSRPHRAVGRVVNPSRWICILCRKYKVICRIGWGV